MYNAIFVEMFKLKRSRMFFYCLLAGIIPSTVKFLQHCFSQNCKQYGWEWFAASNREISVLLTITAIIMMAAFIFGMEYMYGTVSGIFTSGASRTRTYLAKLFAALVPVVLIILVSVISDLIFGWIALGTGMPAELLTRYIKAVLSLILSYFLVSVIVAAIAAITRKFVLSAVISFGYIMLVFPFHLKGNVFICPFMTPTVIAAKIFGTGNYIFNNYYTGTQTDPAAAILFLAVLAAVMTVIGLISYIRQ